MTLDQLALFAIAVFAFMALAVFFNTWRSVRKLSKRTTPQRVRRLIGGDEAARAAAVSVVKEIAEKHPEEVEEARRKGHLTPVLGDRLDEARNYYLGRVESRHKPLFHDVVDEIILQKKKKKGEAE